MSKKISALEVANLFASNYGLSGPKAQDGIRKKIERVCQKMIAATDDGRVTNLWDASAIEYENNETGQKYYRHFFSTEDVDRMLQNKELLQYLHKRASAKGKTLLQGRIDLVVEADRREKEYVKYLEKRDSDTSTGCNGPAGVSMAEVREREMYIMLRALFLRHFTPINRKQLITDMDMAQMEGITDTINIIENLKRLEEDAYYSEKPVENPAKRPSQRSVKSFKKRQPRGASKRPSKPEKSK